MNVIRINPINNRNVLELQIAKGHSHMYSMYIHASAGQFRSLARLDVSVLATRFIIRLHFAYTQPLSQSQQQHHHFKGVRKEESYSKEEKQQR